MMDARLRIAKNTAALLLLRFVVPLLSVAVVLAVSRVLGAEGLGRYTLAFTFLSLFNTVAPLGLYALITREIARDRACVDRVLANAVALGVVCSIVLTLIMAGLSIVLHYDAANRTALALLSLALLPCTLNSYFEAVFAAFERMELIAMSTLVEHVLKVGGALALLLSGYGLDAVIMAAVASRVVACLLSVHLLGRLGVRLRFAIERTVLATLVREAPTFLLTSVFATLYWRIDVLMLAQFRPVQDVGCYGAAYRLLDVAIVLPQSLCLALYPPMATAMQREPSMLPWLGGIASRYLFAASLPAAVCATLVAGPILAFLYGDGFRNGAATLAILMWTLVPYGWVRYHAYVLVAAGHQRTDLLLNVLMTSLNVLLNLALIPRWSYLGAAVATLASVSCYALAQQLYVSRRLPGHGAPLHWQPLPLLAALLSGECVWILREQSIVMTLAVGAAVYGGTLLITGFFTARELELLRVDRLYARFRLLARTG